jgi:hypothetical protein
VLVFVRNGRATLGAVSATGGAQASDDAALRSLAGQTLFRPGAEGRASEALSNPAGSNIVLAAADLVLNDSVSARQRLTIVPDARVQTVTVGGGDAYLSNAEAGRLSARQLEVSAFAQAVTIGALTLSAGQTPDVAFKATSVTGAGGAVTGPVDITINGPIGFYGPAAGKRLSIGTGVGDSPTAPNVTPGLLYAANSVRLNTTSGEGGGFDLREASAGATNGTVRVGAVRFIAGIRPELPDPVLTLPLDPEAVQTSFVLQPASALYRSPAGYDPSPRPIIAATSLSIAVRDYALIQNTAPTGPLYGGLTLSNVRFDALDPGTANVGGFVSPVISVFGDVNGKSGVAAALDLAVTTGSGIQQTRTRINGCIVGQGTGCIVNLNTLPQVTLLNLERGLLVTQREARPIDTDLITGAANESLWPDRLREPAPETAEGDPR